MKSAKHEKTEEWHKRRQEIIDAAAALFAQRGKDGVSMRDIGKVTDNNISTLYHYFSSKTALYDSVCAWAFQSAAEYALASLQGVDSDLARFHRYVEANTNYVLANSVASRILEQELLFRGTSAAIDIPNVMVRPARELGKLLTSMDSPLLQKIPADRLATIVWDVIYGIVRYNSINMRILGRASKQTGRKKIFDEVWTILVAMLGLIPSVLSEIPEAVS